MLCLFGELGAETGRRLQYCSAIVRGPLWSAVRRLVLCQKCTRIFEGVVAHAVCDVHQLVPLTRLTAALTAATIIDVESASAAAATDAHPKLAVNV